MSGNGPGVLCDVSGESKLNEEFGADRTLRKFGRRYASIR